MYQRKVNMRKGEKMEMVRLHREKVITHGKKSKYIEHSVSECLFEVDCHAVGLF